jgi:phosphosulfolactate synthase (CoM biosynthesis protein A)
MGMNRVADLIETAGDYIDLVKIAIGAFRLQNEDFLRRKIDAFQRAQIGTWRIRPGKVARSVTRASGCAEQFVQIPARAN